MHCRFQRASAATMWRWSFPNKTSCRRKRYEAWNLTTTTWLLIEERVMGAIELLSPLQLSRVATDYRVNGNNTLWVTMTRSAAGRCQNFSLDLLHDVCT